MPWSETTPMDQKTQFIADYLRQSLSMSELCDLYGISRKTGYKLVGRYLKQGPSGLEDRSRRPSSSPNHTAEHIVEAIVALRQRHPSWGSEEAIADPREAPSKLGSARTQHRVRYPEPSGTGAQEANASPHWPSGQAFKFYPGAQ